jgi:hypothetical protein
VVTLHDTNFPGAGVRYVVEYLNTCSDCEVINFEGLGAGTALVRIRGTDEPERASFPAGDRANCNAPPVIVRPKPNAILPDPPTIGWRYLESEAFATRSVIAARFMRGCRSVVEIGSGRTSIDTFLTGRYESIVVLDPFIREGRSTESNASAEILRLRARFQDVTWEIGVPRAYGLVLLGLELQGLNEDDYRELFRLVENAAVTVIEFPTSWSPSREQFERIRSSTATRERFVCKLDLTGNDVGHLEHSWPPRFDREMHVLEPISAR